MQGVMEAKGTAIIHPESRAVVAKNVQNYCPMGCKSHELDEYGYCHHLQGFTDNRETFEPVSHLYRLKDDGTPYDTGFRTVNGRQQCQPGDEFVNPERVQVDKGVTTMAKAWVSDRVYRKCEKPEEAPPPNVKPSERHSLKIRLRELEKMLEEKKDRERIAALEKELGIEPTDEQLEELTAPK